MSIANFIKVIGRGSKGAGDLDQNQAKTVFAQILEGTVSDLELGAFCIAMRVKGETVAELMGFMDALEPHLLHLKSLGRPTIILPSYNGARKQVNLTPLLAGLLSAQGFCVIVQGVQTDPSRVTSYDIFQALNWPILQAVDSTLVPLSDIPSHVSSHALSDKLLDPLQDQFETLLNRRLPIFCPLEVIAPSLQKLLDIRKRIGLRNSGHVLAKLIHPLTQPAWQISNYTHPEYPQKLKEYFQLRHSNAILMRGSEGEPTASLNRLPEMHFLFANGKETLCAEQRFIEVDFQVLTDLQSTAEYTQQVMSGAQAAPKSISQQVVQLTQTCNLNV